MKTHKVYVILNGGIGNQLFGLAAAFSVSNKVVVIDGASNATKSAHNLPAALDLVDGKQVKILPLWRTLQPLFRKVHNYLLVSRLGIRNHWTFKFIHIILYFAEIITKLSSNFFPLIFPANDLGFVSIPARNVLLIGYFQTYRWLDITDFRTLLESNLKKIDLRVLQLITKAKEEHPLIVHIRLGDYKSEESFGILGKTYYDKALATAVECNPNLRIWVFSDEPKEARKMISDEYLDKCYWASEENELDALETLAVMRYGCNYVIGNSTFAWWGAKLSLNEAAEVYFPSPWFLQGKDPNLLIPENWKPILRDGIK